jgi:hypothetical protein
MPKSLLSKTFKYEGELDLGGAGPRKGGSRL